MIEDAAEEEKSAEEKTEKEIKVPKEVKEIKFEGHKLRAEISQLENGDETLRLTSEKDGKEMPGGVHGKDDPMEELINKYLGEDDEEEENHDELKH